MKRRTTPRRRSFTEIYTMWIVWIVFFALFLGLGHPFYLLAALVMTFLYMVFS